MIISIPFSNSQLMANYVISSTGTISASNVTAASGTPSDIQSAVDQVFSAGGGNVYIPAGNWVFNPPAGGVGVSVPPGVNLIGAGKGVTILRETTESKESTMIRVNGILVSSTEPQIPVRVQGISLIGYVPSRADADSTTNTVGLQIQCIKDFVVYDCEFSNFVNCGFSADNNDGYNPSRYVMRGVVSHCSFDQPYKDDLVIQNRIWGYGIIILGSGTVAETDDVRNLLGKYEGTNNVVYVEDCDFRRCRHAIASNMGSYYVARHNYFTEMIQAHYGSYIDAHGGSKGVEIYENVIENSPVDYRTSLTPPESYIGQYLGIGIGMRGGSGVIWGNTINNCLNGIRFYSDFPSDPDLKVQDFYTWGNTFNGVTNPISSSADVIEGQDYFLRAPNQAQDGFTYTPYPYPHHLVLEGAP